MNDRTRPAPAVLEGSDEMLKGFSTRPIPQHRAGADGHGRGNGIAGAPSQAGQPQPLPQGAQRFPAVVAGRAIPPTTLGSSSETARRRAAEDEIERLVQVITDKIIQIIGSGR